MPHGQRRPSRPPRPPQGRSRRQPVPRAGPGRESQPRWLARAPLPRLPSEPALAPSELEEGFIEGVRTEVWPERLTEVELRVGRLPDQEVGEALLPAGPDHEVGIGQTGRVQGLCDRGFVDRLRRCARCYELADRIDELRPPRVVEGDVEE